LEGATLLMAVTLIAATISAKAEEKDPHRAEERPAPAQGQTDDKALAMRSGEVINELCRIIDRGQYEQKKNAVFTDAYFGAATDYGQTEQAAAALSALRKRVFRVDDAGDLALNCLRLSLSADNARAYPYLCHESIYSFMIQHKKHPSVSRCLIIIVGKAKGCIGIQDIEHDSIYGLYSAIHVLEGYFDAAVVPVDLLTEFQATVLAMLELKDKNGANDSDAGKASARMLREVSASLASLIKKARNFPAFRTDANQNLADY
jgi:hypothetical protein